jgi:peptide/nickel transport system substrate-binding protein
LADKNVRQALNYATDKQSIIDGVLFGRGKPALSPLFLADYTNESFGYPFDLAKAKELLAASAYPNGFPITVTYVGGNSVSEQTLTILKDQWSQLGVDLTLKAIEEGVYWDTWSGSDFELIWVKGTNDIWDPAENLHFNMMGKEGGSDSAFTGYSDPALSELVLAAEKELDRTKRQALYDQIQETFMADGPTVYLFHPVNLWATSDKVGGFKVYKTGLHPFWNTYLKK